MIEEIPKLIQPRFHKAKVLIWSDLTVNDMDRFQEITTPDQIKDEIAAVFHLGDYKDNLKTAIIVDLYFYTINFARENEFSKEQASAFFSIVKRTHEVCVETPFGNVEQCFTYFRELILCHAVKRPPFSIDLFSPDEVRKITNYVVDTYFRHYKMYKYVFTPLVRLDLSMTYIGMPETPVSSEAGEPAGETDVGVEGEGDATNEESGAADQAEQKGEEQEEETPAETPKLEESPAASELRGLIRDHLSDEIKKLKASMETKLKESEDIMNQKLATLEGTGSAKGSRGSGKSRKKID